MNLSDHSIFNKMSGDSRATVQVPTDAIIIDPPDPVNNNSSESPAPATSQNSKVVIGEPAEEFNIHQMMIISHNYFEKVQIPSDDGGQGDVRARCLMCGDKGKEVLLKISDGNLRGVEGHMQALHKKHFEKYTKQKTDLSELRQKSRTKRNRSLEKNSSLTQPKLAFGGGEKVMHVDFKDDPALQARFDRAQILFAAKTLTAFNALKHAELYVKALLPKSHQRVKVKSKQTLSRHTDKMADDVRRDLMSIIKSVLKEKESKTFGFSTDLYSSPSQYSIIALTVHFSDQQSNLWEFCLYSEYFGQHRHTGENILFVLESLFKEAGLDGDDVTRYILMDNASNNKRCATLGAGEHTVLWCANHTLQLAIHDAMKVKIGTVRIRKLVKKFKDVSNLVRRCEARRDELKEACREKDISFIYPVKPGKTRWNSMEGNIHSCLKLRTALLHLSFYDRGNNWAVTVPSFREFDIADAVQKCLQPLKIATKIWEADRKCAIHEVVKQLFNIRTALQDLANSSPYVKMFARNLLKQVEKRFPKCGTMTETYAVAHLVDPASKGIVLHEFDMYDRTLEVVKRMARKYDPPPPPGPGTEENRDTGAPMDQSSEPLTGLERLKKKRKMSGDIPVTAPVASRIEIELERYQNMPLESCGDPLESWKKNEGSFTVLRSIALDILPIPPSSSSSERVFSVATRVSCKCYPIVFLLNILYSFQACRKERLRMAPRTITNLMMINLNADKIEEFKRITGITQKYTGDIKKLVDIRFPDELDVQTEPPVYNNEDLDVGIGYDVEDELFSDSDNDSSESGESDTSSDDEDEEEEN